MGAASSFVSTEISLYIRFIIQQSPERLALTNTIYGIKNCDTMKKARAWLDEHGVAYDFHDYKTAGIDRARLEGWAQEARLGNIAQPRRHHVSQIAGRGQGGIDRDEGAWR